MIALSLSLAFLGSLAFAGYVLWLRSERNALAAAQRAEKIATGLVAKWNEHDAEITQMRSWVNTLAVERGLKLGQRKAPAAGS